MIVSNTTNKSAYNKCTKCGVIYTLRYGLEELCYVCSKEKHDKEIEEKKKQLEEDNK